MACVPGFPGAPGRDGRDGAKGNLGSPGKTGLQGPSGAEGKKGAKGEPGIQGPTGQKGQRGDKGDSGTPRLSSHMNWKECTWKKEDSRDAGEIRVSDFLYFHHSFCVFLSHLYCFEKNVSFFTNVFYSHTDASYLMEVVNLEFKNITCWFYTNKLCINVKKSNFIIFRPRQNRQRLGLVFNI